MATRSIYITGSPVLHTPALPVTVFDDDLFTLIDDMFETMYAAPGVGLAAPQVGVNKRMFVYSYLDEQDVEHTGVVINPELFITPTTTEPLDLEAEAEGCLSVPGERFPLRRAERAVLTGVDQHQQPVRVEAEDWFARIFQHEFDHLNGVLYVDRLTDPHAHAAAKVIKKRDWGKKEKTWTPGVDNLEG